MLVATASGGLRSGRQREGRSFCPWPNERGLLTVWFHVPSMVPPLYKTIIGFGEGRIAKNTWVVNRVDSVQIARDHTRLAATVTIRPSRRKIGAEKTQGDGDCKRDESFLSTHGSFLLEQSFQLRSACVLRKHIARPTA